MRSVRLKLETRESFPTQVEFPGWPVQKPAVKTHKSHPLRLCGPTQELVIRHTFPNYMGRPNVELPRPAVHFPLAEFKLQVGVVQKLVLITTFPPALVNSVLMCIGPQSFTHSYSTSYLVPLKN
jgi:hypothetical protein